MCDETCTTDCGKCKGGLTYLYEFFHSADPDNERFWFGPFVSRRDAETAFQNEFGFRPTYTGNRKVH